MRKLTTPEKIQEQILKTFQEKREHIKGKIPQKLKDIPNKFLQPSYMKNVRDLETGGWKKERVENIHWTKARTKISNNKRPSRNKQKFDTKVCETIEPRQEHVEIKDIKLTLMLSHDMSARAFIDFIAMVEKAGAKVFSV